MGFCLLLRLLLQPRIRRFAVGNRLLRRRCTRLRRHRPRLCRLGRLRSLGHVTSSGGRLLSRLLRLGERGIQAFDLRLRRRLRLPKGVGLGVRRGGGLCRLRCGRLGRLHLRQRRLRPRLRLGCALLRCGRGCTAVTTATTAAEEVAGWRTASSGILERHLGLLGLLRRDRRRLLSELRLGLGRLLARLRIAERSARALDLTTQLSLDGVQLANEPFELGPLHLLEVGDGLRLLISCSIRGSGAA